MVLAAVCPILLSLPDVCPVKTPEVELVLLPARPDFSFIDFCQTLLSAYSVWAGGRGGGVGDCGGGMVLFVTTHSVVVVPPSHSHSLPQPWGFHLVKTHRFLV